MGMPALKLEFEETTVEERSTNLEPAVHHIQSDVTEMKSDIRRLDAKFDAVMASISSLAILTEKGFLKLTLWNIGLTAVLLTVLARGFHWI
jgi:hypothetical protein